MACSAVPNILGLGSYLEFLQIFSGKHSGLGGEEPGFSTNSLSWSKLLLSLGLHSSYDNGLGNPLSLPAFRVVVRNLWLLRVLCLQITVCDGHAQGTSL